MIERGEISVDGRKLTTPAVKVTGKESIKVKGKRVTAPEPVRLWRYHKPSGLITTTSDPAGRRTMFEELPKHLPRVMTIGRLDLTTEGLLLLTNDGELARALELPRNAFTRKYRARAHGRITQDILDTLKEGVTVDGMEFAPIHAELERQTGTNSWIRVELSEGKKREVRRALETLGLQVNRLIRTDYGPFELADLTPGAVEEVSTAVIRRELGHLIDMPEAEPQRAPRPSGKSHKSGKPGAVASRLHSRPQKATTRGKGRKKTP